MKKKATISVIVIVLIISAVSVIFVLNNRCDNTPVKSDGVIIYQGRTYHLMNVWATAYEYEDDELLKKYSPIGESVYTIKNDENCNFLCVHGFNDRSLYTCMPISADYFYKPENPKEITVTFNEKTTTISNRDDIDKFYYFLSFAGRERVSYNPDECKLVEYKIKDMAMPISYKYNQTAFIYDGSRWLVHAGEDCYDSHSYYYAYELSYGPEYNVFESLASSYFSEAREDDKTEIYVEADPSMAYLDD